MTYLMLRTLIENTLKVHNDLFMLFTGYITAFDKQEEMLKTLEDVNTDSKDLRIVKNPCTGNKSISIFYESKKYDRQISTPKKQRTRQGYVLSLDLFSMYSENMREIRVGGYNVNNQRYADDGVLAVKQGK